MKAHIERYKQANPNGIVFFEDAHYHSDEIRKICLETIYASCDIVSMNEEELAYTLKTLAFDIDIEDIFSCLAGVGFYPGEIWCAERNYCAYSQLCHVCRRQTGSGH